MRLQQPAPGTTSDLHTRAVTEAAVRTTASPLLSQPLRASVQTPLPKNTSPGVGLCKPGTEVTHVSCALKS